MRSGYFVSEAAILLARKVGGPERDEWVRAMAAEWDALEHGKTWWALGCLGASLHDRLWREWHPVAAALGAMPLIAGWNTVAITVLAPILRETGAPLAVWIAAYLLNPLPIVALLGYMVPHRARFLGLTTGGLFVAAPFVASVLVLNVPVAAWLSAVSWPWLIAYPFAVGAWSLAASLGGRLRRRFRLA